VIAQLGRGDGSALPSGSIDYVVLKNMNHSEGDKPIPVTTTGSPIKGHS
jgi:hypothetical protein